MNGEYGEVFEDKKMICISFSGASLYGVDTMRGPPWAG